VFHLAAPCVYLDGMAIADDIAALEELLNTAAQSVSTDGNHTSFDLDAARRRLAELKAQAVGKTWPQAATINLSSGFPD
jgi:hypothetical protein